MASVTIHDLRGKMFRSKRLMSHGEARERNGSPYVVPLFEKESNYEKGDRRIGKRTPHH
jgi:hypothetical protein